MNLPPLIRQLDEKLQGQPDDVLTALLFLGAAAIVLVAIYGNPLLKAAVAAWIIAP